MLYENNVLHFRHPSDANMFIYSHNTSLTRHTNKILVHMVDRDLQLWTGYFNSSKEYRSLGHDYPYLSELMVVLRGSRNLTQNAHDVREAFGRWKSSTVLIHLCASLRQTSEKEGVKVKVIFVRLAVPDHERLLLGEYASELDPHPEDSPGPRLRTKWTNMDGCQVAFDATSTNNPWDTKTTF